MSDPVPDMCFEQVWEQFREMALAPELTAEEVKRHRVTFLAAMQFMVGNWEVAKFRPAQDRFMRAAKQDVLDYLPGAIEKAGLKTHQVQ